MADPYFKGMQEYAKKKRQNAIDSHIEGTATPPEPAASAPQGGMSQSEFGGKKAQPDPRKQAKLAELLRKRAQQE